MLYLSHGLQHPKSHNHFQSIFSELRSQAGDPPWNSTWNKHKYVGKWVTRGAFHLGKIAGSTGNFPQQTDDHPRYSTFSISASLKQPSRGVTATSKQCDQWDCKRGSMAGKLFHLTQYVFGISNQKFCLVNGKRPLYYVTKGLFTKREGERS